MLILPGYPVLLCLVSVIVTDMAAVSHSQVIDPVPGLLRLVPGQEV